MLLQRLSDEVLHGPAEIGDFLSHLLFPSRVTVRPVGDDARPLTGDPTMQVASLQLRSLSLGLVHVDRPVRLDVQAIDGPVMMAPVGYGSEPRTVTRPATSSVRREAAVAPTGSGREQLLPGGYVWALLGMSQPALEREAVAIVGGAPTRPIRFEPVLDLTSTNGRQLEAALYLLVDQVRDDSPLLGSDLAERRLEQVVLDMFLLSADHIGADVFDADGTTVSTPWVRQAVELIDRRPEQSWTVPELSQEVVVSARALYEGFRRELDTTPMGYLQDVRLARARAELARRDVRSTVTTVASRCGFQHLGRFARVYRAKFGETPSQTLRGARDLDDD